MADRYDTESAMYPVLFEYLRDQGRFVCMQVPVRSYRADFVSFQVNWDAARLRLQYGLLEPIHRAPVWRLLLTLRQYPGAGLADLPGLLRLTPGYVRSLLNELERLEVLSVNRSRVDLLYWPDLLFRDAQVVEAKLSDWKRAVRQAMRYACSASQLYIALPQRLADQLANDPPPGLARSGVGILAVNSGVRIALPSREFGSGRYTIELHQLSEYLWSEILHALRRLNREAKRNSWLPVKPEDVPSDLPADVR
ncbi:hypothetical protein caldi_30330 [Caldinitratiruptor microaerophilus]|uniref:Transcriptional regulator n=1 Tax=Caldinitratiruptor microaerophilus TaxID=671077 RepID=A0AA35CNV9_9FIRM|nr:hypothetical protein caldi_30330 [Caldinitratiruptor microaerophilus]